MNTRDLVAKIQLSDGISSIGNDSRSIGGSSGIDEIVSKLDILSGSNSTADAVI